MREDRKACEVNEIVKTILTSNARIKSTLIGMLVILSIAVRPLAVGEIGK